MSDKPQSEHSPQDAKDKRLVSANDNSIFQQIWKARVSYAMLLPFAIPFIVFFIFPITVSAYLSLTDYNGSPTRSPEWVGGENFSELLSIEFKYVPRRTDDDTGEILFQCGRSRVTESEVAAEIADGNECEPAYASSRDVLSDGYREFDTFFSNDKGQWVIGAKDTRFWRSLSNTTTYVISVVMMNTLLGLGLALALQSQSRINMILRVVFFLPTVTSGVAITVVWGWIFKGQSYGLVNAIRAEYGLPIIEFLNNPNWTMPIIVMLAIWGGMGYNMIMFLAGLQSIPNELYEAAQIDGASVTDRFTYITLPLLRPTLLFIIVTGVIGAFQVFESIYVLFASSEGIGGPLDSGLTIVPYLYEQGLQLVKLGYGSAMAWVLFVIIFVLTLINLRLGRVNEAA